MPQGNGVGFRVIANLPLGDGAFDAVVNKFHRIFDGEDVPPADIVIQIVNHGRQSGAFAGAGWPGDQNQPAFLLRQFL